MKPNAPKQSFFQPLDDIYVGSVAPEEIRRKDVSLDGSLSNGRFTRPAVRFTKQEGKRDRLFGSTHAEETSARLHPLVAKIENHTLNQQRQSASQY
jgi:hypothetical protein